MDIDYGVIIGLIGAALVAVIVLLSYTGAYYLGRFRGQRDAERRFRVEEQERKSGAGERLAVVETAVEGLARAVERMTDAQRVALLQSRGSVMDRNGSRATGPGAATPTPS